MISFYRKLGLAFAVAASAALLGCQTDGPTAARHLQPLSPKILALMEQKNMGKEDPIVIRIFKEESELEVWKQDRTGRMALLKTYPICRWSGELGPKFKEGDRQAPEGFYTITPSQMNPNSSLYLSFDLGYPNAFDRAHARTGTHLMVHGDCSSRGCYAMTDEQISEVYALAREAFFAGQKSFQVQAYPFRMTVQNLARHRSNPHLAFWKNLKEGSDLFEVTRAEPKVSVCERRYFFATSAPGPMSPDARCPAPIDAPEIARAVALKKQGDEQKIASLVAAGTQAAPIRTNTDGGMHSVFMARLKSLQAAEAETSVASSKTPDLPGTIPQHVSPPREPSPVWADSRVDKGERPVASVARKAGLPAERPSPPAKQTAQAQPPAFPDAPPGLQTPGWATAPILPSAAFAPVNR